jgi:hypothetical protein
MIKVSGDNAAAHLFPLAEVDQSKQQSQGISPARHADDEAFVTEWQTEPAPL